MVKSGKNSQTGGRGGSPTWEKFPHFPVFFWATSFSDIPQGQLQYLDNLLATLVDLLGLVAMVILDAAALMLIPAMMLLNLILLVIITTLHLKWFSLIETYPLDKVPDLTVPLYKGYFADTL